LVKKEIAMILTKLGIKTIHTDAMHQLNRTDWHLARIINESKSGYTTCSQLGESHAKISGNMRHRAKERANLPIVGDWVAIETQDNGNLAIIHDILPRTNTISRKVPGENTEEQPMASNVDKLFIVTGLDDNFSCSRIERYLNLAWNCGTQPVIILNKKDLLSDEELSTIQDEIEMIAFGTPYHFISSISTKNLDVLNAHFAGGNTITMVGSSGAGKSTLTNLLLGEEKQKTTETREFDSKGRHTTTSRTLFVLPNDGVIIDTPGIRELQLWTDNDQPMTNFEDFESYAANCRFSNCSHDNEPGCAVLEAVSSGFLTESRMNSYHKLNRELNYLMSRKKEKSWDSRLEDRKFGKERHSYLKNRNRN